MATPRSMPEDIRIVDLAEPVLTEGQKAALAAADGIRVEFDSDGILNEAKKRTGLSNFGDEDFRERLQVWVQSLSEDETLSSAGRIGAWSDTVRYATNRLRLEDLVSRHPEILDVRIEKPIIIIGLPRSGTTHLLNLISADSRLRSLPYWESLEPVLMPGDNAGPDGLDPRLRRCQENFERTDGLLPYLRAMHHMTPEHVHEEIELQALDFSSYVLEWVADVPRLRDAYLATDQTASYAYMKKALQACQWQRGPNRWILKSPQHLEQIGPLLANFPDATFAVTARDPVSVIASTVTMNAYASRIRCRRIDLDAILTYWTDRIETLLRRCVRDRDLLPSDSSVDVLFHDFMADDIGMVERIYQLADHPMTDEARSQLDTYMEHNPRGKYGRVRYDLKADFGVDPAELRKRFDFYFERFPIQAEGD
ncbi:MAG: sulfotransferase [Myxococcota bacterium]|nr:sulfotransferase [Myxococcota bacterium]